VLYHSSAWPTGRAGAAGANRPPWLRAAALAATALLAAACSGGSARSGTSSAKPLAVALDLYASCLRSHGLPDVYVSRAPSTPNPDTMLSYRGFAVQGASQSAPHLMPAMNACQHLLPGGTPSTGAQAWQHFLQALKGVACMRARGYPDLPDPTLQGGGLSWPPLPADIDADSPQFQAAKKACGPGIPPGLGSQP
jgi:hypothetical protein